MDLSCFSMETQTLREYDSDETVVEGSLSGSDDEDDLHLKRFSFLLSQFLKMCSARMCATVIADLCCLLNVDALMWSVSSDHQHTAKDTTVILSKMNTLLHVIITYSSIGLV